MPVLTNIIQGRLLDELPEDIWIYIIKLYITDYDVEFPHMVVDRLLPLMLVSRNWGSRIQATPTLWTDVVIDDRIEDLGMKVISCLHFSQNAPMMLYFFGMSYSWNILSTRTLSERSRISALVIGVWMLPPRNQILTTDRIDTLLTELLPLPALRTMDFSNEIRYYPDIELFKAHPNLSHIGAYFLPVEAIDQAPSNLQTLYVNQPPKNILPLLRHFTSLKSVSFFLSHYTSNDGYTTTISDGPLGWTSLRNSWPDNKFNLGLLSRLRDTLVYLSIEIVVNLRAIDFLRELGELNQLYDCTISIHFEDEIQDKRITSDTGSSCRAKKLTIYLYSIEKQKSGIEAVASTLQIALPMVTELKLEPGTGLFDDVALFLSGRGFDHLTHLIIYAPDDLSNITQYDQPALPGSLTSISVDVPMETLKWLKAPNVAYIDIRADSGYGSFNLSEFNHWPDLCSLTLEAPFAHWARFSPRNLQRIIYKDLEDSTSLCHYLAVYPLPCPALEYLEIHIITDWDVFFIMLERRNLSHNPGVSPLKHIVLPQLCPRYLQRPIRQLLQRKSAVRPSYYNLSAQRAWEDIKNPKITGCISCLQMLCFCQKPISSYQGLRLLNVVDAPDYPNDLDEILSTREARSPRLTSVDGRIHRCSKWVTWEPMSITEDSGEDASCEWSEEQYLRFLYDDDLAKSDPFP